MTVSLPVMLDNLKSALKTAPLIGPTLVRLRTAAAQRQFNSAEYWERRYRFGQNSGAGSYAHLAEFKARFMNEFVQEHCIRSVIEFGCGDGNQLALANYPSYVGVDVSDTALAICRSKFSRDRQKQFFKPMQVAEMKAELGLSLDVIYHLIEDDVFDTYMRALFNAATRYVVIYASNKDEAHPSIHVQHREFTKWISAKAPEWELERIMPNAYPFDPGDPENTSFADFYVYALAT